MQPQLMYSSKKSFNFSNNVRTTTAIQSHGKVLLRNPSNKTGIVKVNRNYTVAKSFICIH